MLDKFFYESSSGNVVEFGKDGIYANYSDLRDYEWEYDVQNGVVNEFKRALSKKTLPATFISPYNEESRKRRDEVFEIFEKDIISKTKGRLFIGDWYLQCWVFAMTNSDYLVSERLVKSSIKLLTDKPEWIREKTIPFMADVDEEQQEKSASVKTYPYEYSYEYEVDLLMRKVFNEHFTDADFELTIYGPAITPTIIIGGHVYQLNCDLQEGQYIKINSDKKTAYKVYKDGTTESVYDCRNRDYYIYEPIPSGTQTVSWDGSFGFDLKLIMKRSEPSWI